MENIFIQFLNIFPQKTGTEKNRKITEKKYFKHKINISNKALIVEAIVNVIHPTENHMQIAVESTNE